MIFRNLAGFALTLMIAFGGGGVAKAQSAIITFNGHPSDYRLVRGSAEIPVSIPLVLRPRDRIKASRRDRTLTYRLADGSVHRISFDDGEIVVAVAQPAHRSIVSNFLSTIGNQIMRHRARLSQGTTRGIDLEASRHSFALSFPDLKSGRAIIRAGERPFAFGWTGGKAPFHVTVTDSTGVALVNAMDIRHWQIVIASPLRNFHPGRYKVTLKDADGTERSGSFEAVADQHLTASNISDPEIAAASTIIEIAEQGPSTPNRRFDAYLALAPYYENNETIRDLMDLMALGQINFGGN